MAKTPYEGQAPRDNVSNHQSIHKNPPQACWDTLGVTTQRTICVTMATHHRCLYEDRPLASVLVINWNGRRFLDACIRSLLKNSCPHCTEIILVDNGSTDDSVPLVKVRFPQVSVVSHPRNFGFSQGYNLAVPKSRGDYLIFLNNDTVVDEGWLDPLLDPFLTSPKVGMTTSKVIFLQTSIINSMGGCLRLWTGASEIGFGDDCNLRKIIREPFYANGVAMAIPRLVFDGVGGFDDQIFAYCEDLDLSWRVRLTGYKISYCPDSIVYHHYSGSWGRLSPARIRLMTRHYFRTLFKNLEPSNLTFALVGFGIFSLSKGALLTLRERRVGYLSSILLAIRDTIANMGYLRSGQKSTQKLRREPDSTIFHSEGFALFHSPRELLKQLHTIQLLSTFESGS